MPDLRYSKGSQMDKSPQSQRHHVTCLPVSKWQGREVSLNVGSPLGYRDHKELWFC